MTIYQIAQLHLEILNNFETQHEELLLEIEILTELINHLIIERNTPTDSRNRKDYIRTIMEFDTLEFNLHAARLINENILGQ